MKKGKRAQASMIISVILLVLILVIVVVALVVILINPNLFFPKAAQQPSIIIKTVSETSTQPACFYPFRQLGNTCCIDNDMNNVCDSDEIKTAKIPGCSYPYIKDGNSCCLDDNDNGLCDMYEHHYMRYDYRFDRYNRRDCYRYYDSNRSRYYYDCDW